MDIETKLAFSYYEEIAAIREDHGVFLVRHRETGKLFIKKKLSVYNLSVYRQLMAHPVSHVPRILALAEEENELILIEEYIHGDTLQEILKQRSAVTEEETRSWTLQLCKILQELHACTPPIIHRDIKPSNIILSPDGVLWLLDFNAARLAGRSGEEDTSLLGTKGYAAPEQFGFGTTDARTDIYAVGVLMNTLLNGRISHSCTAEGSLAPIIRKCLRMTPSERYPSARALENALNSDWSRLLPPGFRTGNPLHAVIGTTGYALILYLTSTLSVDESSHALLVLNRIFFLLAMLSITLFSCNYLEVRKDLPLCRSRNRFLRLCGILLGDCIILILFAFLLVQIEKAWF